VPRQTFEESFTVWLQNSQNSLGLTKLLNKMPLLERENSGMSLFIYFTFVGRVS